MHGRLLCENTTFVLLRWLYVLLHLQQRLAQLHLVRAMYQVQALYNELIAIAENARDDALFAFILASDHLHLR